jgi:pSer/pThr/pTyr-binding forkhead associated (FHA) protein
MPYVADPDAQTSLLVARPTLCSNGQRFPLLAGVHGLGGRAADAIVLDGLERQPLAARLTVSEDGATLLQRTTAAVVVRVDGETVGIAPVELRHGAMIEFGECRLIFESDVSTSPPSARRTGERSAARVHTTGARLRSRSVGIASGSTGETHIQRDAHATVATDAAFVDMRSGARHPLSPRRIFIGRDDSCDVVVRGNSVSRRHVSVTPVAGGFMLRDESSNGTLVNGVRIVGTYLLGNGDVVHIGDEEFRVELDASAPPANVRGEQTTLLDLALITRGVTEEQARAAANCALTASLEIVRGPFAGACFQVDRAVCSIGRGEDNDVRIRDDTVSSAHATLLRKRGAWFVVDLRSMNGTFVDGSRVSGERELHPGACVRVGAVELVFRAIDSHEQPAADPPRPGVWARLKEMLKRVAPPTG